MKKRLKNISLIVAILSGATLISACSNEQKKPAASQVKAAVKYTCPMHPQVLEDHPGTCPICGMTLVKKAGQASKDAGISLNTVLKPVNNSVVSSVAAITPEQKAIPTTVSANGYLDFDTRTFNNIASRFSGRIEKLYIKYAFQEIHRGQRIFDIYSPELLTAQQDLIFLSKNSSQEAGIMQAAKQKLLLLGMTDAQVEQVVKSEKAFYSLPVYSPYDGHVHDMPHSQMSGTSDNQMPLDLTGNLPLSIKEGMYVEKGQTLFNVVDPHMLWAIIKVYASSIAAIKLHQAVTLSLADNTDKTLSGQVDFIEPTLQVGDKTTSIRVYLHNMNHELKVGSLVKAQIETGNERGLWIPRTALVDLGRTKIVWLKTGAAYSVHQVETGINEGNEIQITKGITVADSIAVNAQYLSDSESFIKTQSNE
ncbi:efflux RND transporter periplasmic adaptor subunit [Mucilaginibacter sp. L3T2-6]|uniref:efflux RND transporter periplasmic adaptor subunit n=1 Tax=Mucilaginibacter sp. L3T2-6 TaxID=3062491 RepID=UPI0026766FC0|nr:efflux RND transporter periplasmic adaptor subunit [Mucilaginibacter sp. L3T2-6]MDO3643721.1 efflux RND transporter periplasmic adaptor subunit [Mucilaginibacter sp. L3T2-6]MDV6216172.1 efflux RND transporter periplasmic adaptor subunit [Mucilaginibacter sp. L3T2-6]